MAAPRGNRCRAAVPHGHWKTTTVVGALRLSGVTAPMTLDGAMNAAAFLAYVKQVLGPTLAPGDIVVMDNLPAQEDAGGSRGHRRNRGGAAPAAALQPRLQSDRACLLEDRKRPATPA
jgi:hypothetical protein